jgi:sulfonate transport system permease protein
MTDLRDAPAAVAASAPTAPADRDPDADPGAGGRPAGPDLVRLPTRPAGEEGDPRPRLPRGIERLAGVVALFALWELAARVGWLAPDVLAGPSTVLTAGWDLARDGTIAEAMQASVTRVAWGLGLGIPIGTLLALAAGLSRAGDDLVDANLQMLRFVPIIGLQPLLIVWLGVGEATKVTMIVLGVAFPIYVNTSAAIRSIDPRFHELSDVVGLSRLARIRRIVLPGARDGFLVGLRLATGVAWLLLVFAEQINASSGIGYLMVRAQTFFQTDVIVVCLVIYAVLGLASDAVVRALERRLLRWQPGR